MPKVLWKTFGLAFAITVVLIAIETVVLWFVGYDLDPAWNVVIGMAFYMVGLGVAVWYAVTRWDA